MRKIVLLLPVILLLFYGCATIPKQADLKESLRSKAEEYWKLRFQDKYKETYRMEDAANLPSFDEYRATAMLIRKFKIESHSIDTIKVEGDKGIVTVRVRVSKPPIPEPVKDVFFDEWIFKDGKWQHILRLN